MTTSPGVDAVEQVRTVRQVRHYRPDPVPAEVLARLLEVARWTGSGQNRQPWHFVVIDDPETLRSISSVRPAIAWAPPPLAIAIVLDGRATVSEAFDEGRVTKRLLIAARLLGLAGATAWFGDDIQQAKAKEILAIPAGSTARSLVVIGNAREDAPAVPIPIAKGRKPLGEIVHRNRFTATYP